MYLASQNQTGMVIKPIATVLWTLMVFTASVNSQVIIRPNYGLKSHETLEIKKVEITPEKTVVSLSVENRIVGGQFCADKNIFIIYRDGTRSKLTSSAGIPVCPETYKFKIAGERLDFILTFPPLKAGTEWIDIIEECSDNCFSFYGVVLDNDLNKNIDEALSLAEKGEITKSVNRYKEILAALAGKNNGIEGALYSDIITLLAKSGDKKATREWYGKMLSSKSPGLEKYIRNLNSIGIKY